MKSYWPFWFHYQRPDPDFEVWLGDEVELLLDKLWQEIQPKLKESLKESLVNKYLNISKNVQL